MGPQAEERSHGTGDVPAKQDAVAALWYGAPRPSAARGRSCGFSGPEKNDIKPLASCP